MTKNVDAVELLEQWGLDDLFLLALYDVERIECDLYNSESPFPRFEPTPLLIEVFGRLRAQEQPETSNIMLAAEIMRRLLVAYAHARRSGRAGPPAVPLDASRATVDLDLVALDEALQDLEELDSRKSQIVSMRFFAGLSFEELSELLGLSVSAVKGEWRAAKLWLLRRLREDGPSGETSVQAVQEGTDTESLHDIAIVWDPDILSAENYSELLTAINDMAKACGAAEIRRVRQGTQGGDQRRPS